MSRTIEVKVAPELVLFRTQIPHLPRILSGPRSTVDRYAWCGKDQHLREPGGHLAHTLDF